MAKGILDVIRAPAPGMRQVAQSGALPGFVTVALWILVSLLAAGLGLLLGGFASVDELLEGLPPGSVPQEVDEASLESIVFGAQAALIWHVALVVIGASAARGLSYGGSAGSCATSCAAVIGLPLLLLLLLGGLLALFGGGG